MFYLFYFWILTGYVSTAYRICIHRVSDTYPSHIGEFGDVSVFCRWKQWCATLNFSGQHYRPWTQMWQFPPFFFALIDIQENSKVWHCLMTYCKVFHIKRGVEDQCSSTWKLQIKVWHCLMPSIISFFHQTIVSPLLFCINVKLHLQFSCARTLIFGSFSFIAFLSEFFCFFLFVPFRFFCGLVFYYLFFFFRFGFLSSFVSPLLFRPCLSMFFGSCGFISSLPQLAWD
jgi:hypothetical protein